MGRTAHSWPAIEIRHSSVANDSCQVHGPAPEAAITDLSHVSNEPHEESGHGGLFVVPSITFRLVFVFVILAHDRGRPVHFAVTANPTAEWAARQLLEVFPWDSAPRYLLRDCDGTCSLDSGTKKPSM